MKKIYFSLTGIVLCLISCSKNSATDTAVEVKPKPTGTKMAYTISKTPVDANSTEGAKSLYAYLLSQFGTKTISGQTDNDADFAHIKLVTGFTPLIRDYDMQPYSPAYSYSWANGGFAFGPYNGSPNVPNAINWYNSTNKKAIIDFQWHWHSPTGGTVGTNTFYQQYTTFDVTKAVIAGTVENKATVSDIDSIAVQLKKLSNAGVPIIWRPLHEAGGTWFWWSAKGPAAYKALWTLMYDRLVNHHGIHNLIWMWNGNDAAWYPGDDFVDIASIDSYPGNFVYTTDAIEFNKDYAITGAKKMIAMSENGPIPDVQAAINVGASWSFFMSWYDISVGNSDQHLKDVYQNPNVINLENR